MPAHDALPSSAPVEKWPTVFPAETSWFWALLLGISMFVGGLLALVIASTSVVLPYDETFSGLTRAQLAAINDRLLYFMAHDRVSLAGTMIAVGVLYVQLAFFGIRRGRCWARVTVLVSAFAGFGSFFLFLGFGYFDPFHAFVTAILFPLLLLALHGKLSPPSPQASPSPRQPSMLSRSSDVASRYHFSPSATLLVIALAARLHAASACSRCAFCWSFFRFSKICSQIPSATRVLPLRASSTARANDGSPFKSRSD